MSVRESEPTIKPTINICVNRDIVFPNIRMLNNQRTLSRNGHPLFIGKNSQIVFCREITSKISNDWSYYEFRLPGKKTRFGLNRKQVEEWVEEKPYKPKTT